MNNRLPYLALALAIMAGTVGTPYLRITWECRGMYGRCVQYVRCDYLGIGGQKSVLPQIDGGNCAIVKFYPLFGTALP